MLSEVGNLSAVILNNSRDVLVLAAGDFKHMPVRLKSLKRTFFLALHRQVLVFAGVSSYSACCLVCQWCGNTVTCGFECSCFVGPSWRGYSLEKSCPEYAKASPRFDGIHPYGAIKASLMGELTFTLDCEQKLWPSDCSFEELMGEITQSCLKGWCWSTESTLFMKFFPFLMVVLNCNEACIPVYNVGWKGLGWLSHVMHQKIIQMLSNFTSLSEKVWHVSAKDSGCGFWFSRWVKQQERLWWTTIVENSGRIKKGRNSLETTAWNHRLVFTLSRWFWVMAGGAYLYLGFLCLCLVHYRLVLERNKSILQLE